MTRMRSRIVVAFTLLVLLGNVPGRTEADYFSSFPERIRSLLSEFQECVTDEGSEEDIREVAEFITNFGLEELPAGWKKRFCDAQRALVLEYAVSTVSVEGVPLELLQRDSTNDGDALVPHSLVVGGRIQPQFSISALDHTSGALSFSEWVGTCVPFLFEVESQADLDPDVESGTPRETSLYIATICRTGQFRFQYYRYRNEEWSEIQRGEFPKERALENLWDWQGGGIRYSRDTPKFIQDQLKEGRREAFVRKRTRIAADSPFFYTGLTARMWAHLESGVDFWQFDDAFSGEEVREHARSYSRKYSLE